MHINRSIKYMVESKCVYEDNNIVAISFFVDQINFFQALSSDKHSLIEL